MCMCTTKLKVLHCGINLSEYSKSHTDHVQAVCKHSFQKSALVLEKSLVFVLSSFVLSSVILLAADPFICLQLLVICLCNTHSHSGGVFLPLTRGPW